MTFLATPIAHAAFHGKASVDIQQPSDDSDLIIKAFNMEYPALRTACSYSRYLSHFVIHRSLYTNANSGVWAATFVPTGQIYAIKVVSVADRSQKAYKALRREVDIFFRVSSIPGAVRVHLSTYDACSATFVTDLYRAGNLAHFLTGKGRITCRQSVYYLQQLLQIIERFHAGGIVHGDITPENLLVEDDGALALGDMGAALPFDVPDHLACLDPDARADGLVRLTPLSAVGGTSAFMAPEIWHREGYGPAVDYWAAVLCYFVIRTGRINPWGKTADEMVLNQEETSRRICEGSITILPQDGLNPVEKSFFKLTLDKDVKQRLTPSQIKDHTLFRVYGSDWDTVATPPFRPDLDTFLLDPSTGKPAMDVLGLAMPKYDDLNKANLDRISDDFSSIVEMISPATYTSETSIKEAQFKFSDAGILASASSSSSPLAAPDPGSPSSSDGSILEFDPFQSRYSPDSSITLTASPSSLSVSLTPDYGSSASVMSNGDEKQESASPTQRKLVSAMAGTAKKRSSLRVRFFEINEFEHAYSSGSFQASGDSPIPSSLLFRVDSDHRSSPVSSSPCPQKRIVKLLPKMMITKTHAESAQNSDRTSEHSSCLPVRSVSTSAAQPRSKTPAKKALPRATSKPVSTLPIVSKASAAMTIPRDQTPQSNTNNRTSKKKTAIPATKSALKPLTLACKYFPANETPVSVPIKHNKAQSSSPSRFVPAQSPLPQITIRKSSSSSMSPSATPSPPSRTNRRTASALPMPTQKSTLRTPVKSATNVSAWTAKLSSSPQRVGVEGSAWNVMPLAWMKTSPVAAKPRAGVWY